jgi:hypothetical protein
MHFGLSSVEIKISWTNVIQSARRFQEKSNIFFTIREKGNKINYILVINNLITIQN